jgi:hypothetical protein
MTCGSRSFSAPSPVGFQFLGQLPAREYEALRAEFAQGARHVRSGNGYALCLGDRFQAHRVLEWSSHLALPHGTRRHAGAARRKALYPGLHIGDVVADAISKFSVDRAPAQYSPVLQRFSRDAKRGFELDIAKEALGNGGVYLIAGLQRMPWTSTSLTSHE